MKQMEGMVDSAEFNTALEGMMEQLMSKDILYEPMKDLVDKVSISCLETREEMREADNVVSRMAENKQGQSFR